MNRLARKHEKEINELKTDIHGLKERHKQELDAQNSEAKEKEKKARINERNRHIEIEAQHRARNKKVWYIFATILCVLIPLAIAAYGIYKAWNTQLPDKAPEIITAICGVVGLLLEFVVFKVFYENWFCELKIDKIEEREKKKLDKIYPRVE